jgi:UDP-N-acetylmuramate dehydrogenase
MDRVYENFCLKDHNTFGVDVSARYYVSVSESSFLSELFSDERFRDSRFFLLGGGSNVLFTKDFDGLVVALGFKGVEVVREDDVSVWIRAESGLWWDDLVTYCVDSGYGGVENLALIPGRVGGAPVQNIGAYGVELKDVLESVEVFDFRTGEIYSLDSEQLGLGYRTSIFKLAGQPYIVLSITVKLSKVPVINIGYGVVAGELRGYLGRDDVSDASIRDVSVVIKRIRSRLLPDFNKLGNAGSFFKNPVVNMAIVEDIKSAYPHVPVYSAGDGNWKLSAAWLIDQCGWKGVKKGRAGVYEGHALVLVNHGGASGEEIMGLATDIKKSVHQRFGVTLEEEVTII